VLADAGDGRPLEDAGAGGTSAPGGARAWPPGVRGIRAAFVFFSRIRVGGFPYQPRDWHWAPAHLPLVGAAVGSVSAGVFALAASVELPPLVTAALVLGVSVGLTGALHEDGLADSADGLGGGTTRERTLEIMKDSRIGTYGALALLLSTLVRAGAIAALDPGAWFAVIQVHVWARVGPVWLLCVEPYVNDRTDAKSQGFFETRAVHVLTALGWGALAATLALVLGGLAWPSVLAMALAPLIGTSFLRRLFRRRVGGVTGDLLGAAEQLGEVAAWVALGATLRF
jgi:adenosylcobinamide-GDP ribazoletransferase